MSSSQERNRVLLRVIEELDARPDGTLPREVSGVGEAFKDDTELVGALQMRWYTRLNGRIEIEQQRLSDREDAVVSAWRLTQAWSPGLRRALDQLAEAPLSPEVDRMLAKARRKEHIMLALMAGVATFHDDWSARRGAELELAARQELEVPPSRAPARALL